jgi:hypothetical protein
VQGVHSARKECAGRESLKRLWSSGEIEGKFVERVQGLHIYSFDYKSSVKDPCKECIGPTRLRSVETS